MTSVSNQKVLTIKKMTHMHRENRSNTALVEQSTILEEDNNSDYEPTEQEIMEYGYFLGMSLPEDRDLLYISREGLKAPLPRPWKACKSATGDLYFFNFETGQSSWTHPLDDFFRKKFMETKALKQSFVRKDQTIHSSKRESIGSIRNYMEHGQASVEKYRSQKETALRAEEDRLKSEFGRSLPTTGISSALSGQKAATRRRVQQQVRWELEQEFQRRREEELGQGRIEVTMKQVEEREKGALERRLNDIYRVLHAAHTADKQAAEEQLHAAEEELRMTQDEQGKSLRSASLALGDERDAIHEEFAQRLDEVVDTARVEAEMALATYSADLASDLEHRKRTFEADFDQKTLKEHVRAKNQAVQASEERLLKELSKMRQQLEATLQEFERTNKRAHEEVELTAEEKREVLAPWEENKMKLRRGLEERKAELRMERDRAEAELRERMEARKRKLESERAGKSAALRRESERLTDHLSQQSDKVKQLSQLLSCEASRLQSALMERTLTQQLQQLEANELTSAFERAREEASDVRDRLRSLCQNEDLAATLSRKIDALVKEIDEKENEGMAVKGEGRRGRKDVRTEIEQWRAMVRREMEKMRLLRENVRQEKALLRERQEGILRSKDELKRQTISAQMRPVFDSRRRGLNDQIRRLNHGLARFRDKELRLRLKERRLKELEIAAEGTSEVSFPMMRPDLERIYAQYEDILIETTSEHDPDDIQTVTSVDSQGERDLLEVGETWEESPRKQQEEPAAVVNPFRAALSHQRTMALRGAAAPKSSTGTQFFVRDNYRNRSFDAESRQKSSETRHNSLQRTRGSGFESSSFHAANESSFSRERPADLNATGKAHPQSGNSRMSTGHTNTLITPSPHGPTQANSSGGRPPGQSSYDGCRVYKSFLNF
eukprot:TRINITY_DN1507_c0_g1_i1.p1 TRINITY_DN1507_c0_g1~~TRINITY_DN1507_c0_g1_i1.p1  ORF type:complete len:898 (+),score=268.75 TRINITY_DN1507_c0_g1_i1:213-2906(+)